MFPQGIYHKDYMDERHDPFNHHATFEYKFSFLPRRCHKTNKWLWMTTALRGRVVELSPSGLIKEDRWYNSSEGLIMLLKKVSN